MVSHKLILGEAFTDDRGKLNFFNLFDMSPIVRLYEIKPNSTQNIRAWQGHKKENKWFYCNSGSFVVNIVALDDFLNPSKSLHPKKIILESKNPSVFHVSGGYATGLKSNSKNSSLMVFSNFSLKDSKNDDFRYPLNTWKADW